MKIKLTGSRRLDEQWANAEARLDGTPRDYIWHHDTPMGTMSLIHKDAHSTADGGAFHYGMAAFWAKLHGWSKCGD